MNELQKGDTFVLQFKEFDVITDSAIAELSEKYMPLVINGVDDKSGYKAVKEARISIKNYRVEVEHRRKELTADAVKFQKIINNEAKRVTGLLEPIENHLLAQEKIIDQEIERIKVEKEQQEIQALNLRIKVLLDLQFRFNGVVYQSDYFDLCVNAMDVKKMSAEDFNKLLSSIQPEFDSWKAEKEEEERIKREEAQAQEKLRQEQLTLQRQEQIKADEERKRENERLAQEREKQAIERRRIADLKREEEAKIQAERKRLEQLEQELKERQEQANLKDVAEHQEVCKRAIENPDWAGSPLVYQSKFTIDDLGFVFCPTCAGSMAKSCVYDPRTVAEAWIMTCNDKCDGVIHGFSCDDLLDKWSDYCKKIIKGKL